MIIHTLPVPSSTSTTTATLLTREAFAPFGWVASNPAPAALPHNTAPAAIAAGALPCGAASANQGSAIQYRDLGRVANWYLGRAPSGAEATPRLTMFVCGARTLLQQQQQQRGHSSNGGDGGGAAGGSGGDNKNNSDGGQFFEVKVLERHPFTTQTFCPLGVDPSGPRRYLVIVAPSLAPGAVAAEDADTDLPVPAPLPGDREDEKAEAKKLPGRGLPDLGNLRAFVATGGQAVTYGAGTWHAPMVALGPAGTAIDFVVTQFANGVPVEDCQEVVLRRRKEEGSGGSDSSGGGDDGDDSSGVLVRIPDDNTLLSRLSRL